MGGEVLPIKHAYRRCSRIPEILGMGRFKLLIFFRFKRDPSLVSTNNPWQNSCIPTFFSLPYPAYEPYYYVVVKATDDRLENVFVFT